MRAENVRLLRELPLFAEMADEAFGALVRGAYVQTFPPQVEMIREGEPADFLHVVMSGAVELHAGWGDRETTMAIVRPVATFILAATLRDQHYLMSARTLERSRIALIPSEDVRAAFEQDGAFARAVVVELAGCYRVVIKATKNLKLRTSLERIAAHLLRRRERHGDAFELDVEKRRLASFLGMKPEHLSRAFNALRAYGVEVEGTSVRIGDPQALARLAKPTPLIDDPTS